MSLPTLGCVTVSLPAVALHWVDTNPGPLGSGSHPARQNPAPTWWKRQNHCAHSRCRCLTNPQNPCCHSARGHQPSLQLHRAHWQTVGPHPGPDLRRLPQRTPAWPARLNDHWHSAPWLRQSRQRRRCRKRRRQSRSCGVAPRRAHQPWRWRHQWRCLRSVKLAYLPEQPADGLRIPRQSALSHRDGFAVRTA